MRPGSFNPSVGTAFGLAFVLTLAASAQTSRAPQLQSPVVHPDRTVTFSVRAPNAQKVELSGQYQSLVTSGGHTWMNARHYLAGTLQ